MAAKYSSVWVAYGEPILKYKKAEEVLSAKTLGSISSLKRKRERQRETERKENSAQCLYLFFC